VAPDVAPSVTTYTIAGVAVESPTPAYDATRQRWYVDATPALYALSTPYYARWVIVLGGVTYNPVDWFVSLSAYAAAPGAPTIGAPGLTSTLATFPHTPPSDADYTHTTIYVVTSTGVYSGTGSGSTISVTLPPGTAFYGAIAFAYDNVLNVNLPASCAMVGPFATPSGATVDKPLYVKLFVNDQTTQVAAGPWQVDHEHLAGVHQVGSDFCPMGQGYSGRLRFENHHGVWRDRASFTVRYSVPEGAPYGLGERTRSV